MYKHEPKRMESFMTKGQQNYLLKGKKYNTCKTLLTVTVNSYFDI